MNKATKNKNRKWQKQEDNRFNDGVANPRKLFAQANHRSRNNERQNLRRVVFG